MQIFEINADMDDRNNFETLLRERERLALLSSEISEILVYKKSVEEILFACADAVVKHLNAAFVRIWTLNEKTNILELQVSAGLYTHLDGAHSRIPVGQFKIGKIARDRKAHLTNSVVGDESVSNQSWAKKEKIKSFAGYPLIVEDNLVGVIGIFSKNTFSETDFEAISAISKTIALGIERKKIEKDRFESEERLRLATEAAEMFAWEYNPQTRTMIFSKNFEKVTGFSLDSLTVDFEEILKEFVHSEDVERVKRELQSTISGEDVFQSEMRALNSEGETVWLESNGNVVRSDSENSVKVIGITQNITERKRAGEQLRESEQNLRNLADSLPQLVWMAEPNGHIYWYNKGWFDYTGKTIKQIEDWDWQSVHDPEILPQVEKSWKHSVETEEPFEMEFPLLGADGKYRWFLTRVNPLRDSQGKLLRWLGTNTDIDDSKQIEIEREAIFNREKTARHEAEEANRAKDEFLSVLSHELRTPLNSMLGWVKMLNAGMLDEVQKQKAFVVLERNIRQQNNLIEDLLDVSRIISGKMKIETEEVDLASIVSKAIETIKPLADGKNIAIDFQNAELKEITGDENRLNQIVINLLSNAIKFTPENGKISVNLSKKREFARLKVSDTGIGIAPQFLPHIFERFRQADSTTRRLQSGLGLGLAIVRFLTEIHNGKINATSAGIGKGSTFTVELPFNLNVNKSAKSSNDNVNETKKKTLKNVKILFAADNCEDLQPLKILLRIKKAEVLCVESASKALQILAEKQFDILISDIGLSDMDGCDLLKTLREMNVENSSIPAIALTAYASIQDRQRALNAGFQQHLSKPIDFEQFISAVKNLTNQTKNQ